MTGALAPFSYLVLYKALRLVSMSLHNALMSSTKYATQGAQQVAPYGPTSGTSLGTP